MMFGFKSKYNPAAIKKLDSFSVVLGRYFSLLVIGIIQSAALVLDLLILGIKPTNMFATFAVFLMSSFCFIAIVNTLVYLLGQMGQLLAMVLLIFQLTSSGGTFPIQQTSTNVFTTVHPFVPFTYSINALRETISAQTINVSVIGHSALILFIFIVTTQALCIIFRRKRETFSERVAQRREKMRVHEIATE
ncbi:MAG: YhgE/Pip family protein [Clostridiales Family XIII bacterium]|jgi:putative membrane protein|nr:YhgE/Pip family protein [Clostridiales Family XIII bacterium]